jgi:hypothetical protein
MKTLRLFVLVALLISALETGALVWQASVIAAQRELIHQLWMEARGK